MITVRKPVYDDADVLSAVLCASIRELCSADHHNDQNVIAQWTANKSPEHMIKLLANPRLALFVAEVDQEVSGVGCISLGGEVLLNYVAPAHRFCGVSKALLDHLENALAEHGVSRATLTSTKTAHRFYRAAGWTDCGEPETVFGLTGYPMEKIISRAAQRQ